MIYMESRHRKLCLREKKWNSSRKEKQYLIWKFQLETIEKLFGKPVSSERDTLNIVFSWLE